MSCMTNTTSVMDETDLIPVLCSRGCWRLSDDEIMYAQKNTDSVKDRKEARSFSRTISTSHSAMRTADTTTLMQFMAM